MIFYAKSSPPLPYTETIQQHTEALITCYHQLKNGYESSLKLMTERDWQLLYWAVKYHDVGKYDAVFQNKILRAIKQPSVTTNCNYDVRHNHVSVLAIPFGKLGLDQEEELILVQAVAFHHEKSVTPNHKQIGEIYKQHILPHCEQIELELDIKLNLKCMTAKLNLISHNERIRESSGELFQRYVLIKGLLHRLDHAASAHVPVELATDMNVGEYAKQFITNTFDDGPNALQLFATQHQYEHVVVVAQTGMGKTEAGLLWLGADKGFLTLPLRVSINAMYERIINKKKIGFTRTSGKDATIEEATGLLHSTSMDYLHDVMEADDESMEKIYSQSRQFGNKLIISTIDQILKFPFYYLGFEKEYATVASSKVIIDELQAYDPRIAALIVRAMVLIDRIGGSFMIMTATLPDFYYKALNRKLINSQLPVAYGEFIDDTVIRHHVQQEDASILNENVLAQIIEDGEKYKVLVICNTVKRARELYNLLKQRKRSNPIHLLHSRFIKKDRVLLEKDILDFAKSLDHGIWVTTQLVEASLDIDFDRMYTEMSSLDSQFQRYGRCNRRGEKSTDEVNIRVYTQGASGTQIGKNSVYHDDIYNRSIELFSKYPSGILLESQKQQMIQQLYDEKELEGSSFKQLFDDTLTQLEERPMYEIDNKEAQDLLRDIHEVQAIPMAYLGTEEIEEALDLWKSTKDRNMKRRARQSIEQFTVGVNQRLAKNKGVLTEFPLIRDLYYVDMVYDEETGLDANAVTAPITW
ncbi:CRISPR-associated helicase/endonuclease Cas3 [Paenibacillus sp. IHBB 10380]|uniref:CRISPR-associated helicase/endonuclease Cas3 n=1 Tax=Paenibacillus sp. IHBB 10380 TaxID=1566358 RepID=UPI0005CFE027|nr:CRISPR-associated helicase/endonuclease Cas3 [Paenibacillus sp. IHBB 10380]